MDVSFSLIVHYTVAQRYHTFFCFSQRKDLLECQANKFTKIRPRKTKIHFFTLVIWPDLFLVTRTDFFSVHKLSLFLVCFYCNERSTEGWTKTERKKFGLLIWTTNICVSTLNLKNCTWLPKENDSCVMVLPNLG